MSLFRKNGMKKVILMTEKQRDTYIDRLESANVEFEVSMERDDIYSREYVYVIRVKDEDLKKVG